MGFSEKPPQITEGGGGVDSDNNNRKWVIAGTSLRAPLKPIYTVIPVDQKAKQQEEEQQEEFSTSTTPTGKEARVPTTLKCPPAPRKPKSSLKCNYHGAGGGAREFFTPPDLETVFIRHVVERAN
ncbi:cyclin-dependent protein kinase inhibitor SMR6-like [Arachis stenosperma]|uniref:cyclin-dependent protein kinase inhibitor SMR6-like n=1 Tax=Arachis stenosperma TaxID=217475 RepID=UPI0025AC33F2|nr:cyclin-dependent protein kinase inhibitor SMR6-like [Arachis stenosperma]